MKDVKGESRFSSLPVDEADGSLEPLSSDGSSNVGDIKGHIPRPEEAIASEREMTLGQRSQYKSMRRQDLMDLHMTLSRQRESIIAQMMNVSNVILELAEAYHELKSRTCVPCYLCELDRLIQESLAAYERRQKGANQTVKGWSKLIDKAASAKKRKRATIIAEPPTPVRKVHELYDIPMRQLRHEVLDMETDIEVYRKRIAWDDRKINLMGEQWAADKKRLYCFRYFFLKGIIESAITDYKIGRR